MIHVINALRANLIRREIGSKIERALTQRIDRWSIARLGDADASSNLFQVSRMLRRFDRLRMRQWGSWKDNR